MAHEELTIYDVLRALVDNIHWRTEAEVLRMREAIDRAQENEIFRTEGRFKI